MPPNLSIPHRFAIAVLLVVVLASGCIRKECEGSGEVSCELGSVYPDAEVIDSDDPTYSDGNWTQAEAQEAFAEARQDNTDAYRAYAAARDHAELLECAFCDCGCASSVEHLSAVDCFKDMHGFS